MKVQVTFEIGMSDEQTAAVCRSLGVSAVDLKKEFATYAKEKVESKANDHWWRGKTLLAIDEGMKSSGFDWVVPVIRENMNRKEFQEEDHSHHGLLFKGTPANWGISGSKRSPIEVPGMWLCFRGVSCGRYPKEIWDRIREKVSEEFHIARDWNGTEGSESMSMVVREKE